MLYYILKIIILIIKININAQNKFLIANTEKNKKQYI